MKEFPPSDWKTFRALREIALERFCQRTLDEIDTTRLDDTRSFHERYSNRQIR